MNTKPLLRYNRRGWFKVITWLTGERDRWTGCHIPYVRDGVAWPEVCELVCGPYPTAHEAVTKGL